MRKIGLLLVVAAACGESPPVSTSRSQALSARATLTGNTPPWANSANFKSAAAGTDFVGVRVYLDWQGDAASVAAAVSDPRSPSYGQFLTPQQFRQRFSPSQQQTLSVQDWLTSNGFNIVYTPQNNLYVSAEGTVAQAQAAFGVQLGIYSVNGLLLRAPSSDPSVPANLAGLVSAVVGLDQTGQLVHTNVAKDPDAPPSAGFLNAPPCSAYWAEKTTTAYPNPYGTGALPYAPCGYTPDQIKGAYGISGYDGAGQTVAIIDAYASPTIQQDLDQWSANRGLDSTRITQLVAPGTYRHPERGQKQDPQGWYGEETLDVQAVHGMAPKASIVFVGSANAFQDLDAAMVHVVDRGLAQIVTNSYGYNTELLHPGVIKPFESVLIQAAAQGIGVYFSSGDNSDESLTSGYATVDWPATSPWVTAVGGTSIGVGAGNTYLFETGWGTQRHVWDGSSWVVSPVAGDGWLYGAGGGVSRIFAEPSYQVGLVEPSVFDAQGHGPGRAVPDVAAFADPNTGYLVGQTQQFPSGVLYAEYRIGGTSLSSPIMAGIMALADQAHGKPHGFANPALYALRASAYNDVVNPAATVAEIRVDYVNGIDASNGLRTTLRTMNDTLSLRTTPGWDDVTGMGTPAAGFIDALK